MKSIKLATLLSVMSLSAGFAMAAPEHAVKVDYQQYQQGENAHSAQQNADSHNYFRTINTDYHN